jgi:hypothetical protein
LILDVAATLQIAVKSTYHQASLKATSFADLSGSWNEVGNETGLDYFDICGTAGVL